MERQFVIQYQSSSDNGVDIASSFATVEYSDNCKEKLINEYNSIFKDDPNYKIISVYSPSFPDIDWELIDRMRAVRSICELGHKVRGEAKIKNRQPLSKAYVLFSDTSVRDYMLYLDGSNEYANIIAEELNVDAVEFIDSNSGFVDILLKPNFKSLGPKGFGKKAQELKQVLAKMSNKETEELYKSLSEGNVNNILDIPLVLQDVEVEFVSKPGYSSTTSKFGAVILDTNLSKDLLDRGFISDFRSEIQNIRKDIKLELSDRISIEIAGCSADTTTVIQKYFKKLQKDLLLVNISFVSTGEINKDTAHKVLIDSNFYYLNLIKN